MPDIFVSENKKGEAFKKPVKREKSIKHHDLPGDNMMEDKLEPEKGLPEIIDNIKKNQVAEKTGALKYPLNEKQAEKLPGHTKNPLASFFYFPTKADFVNRDPKEKIILIVRRHPITNLSWLVLSFFLIIFPAFFTVFPIFEEAPFSYKIFSFAAWYLFTFAYMFEKFLNWLFSVNIVTDERIFDVDFYNLIYRKMTDANIDQIQDVTVQMGGGVRTMFNYGDVLVQTAAEVPEIEFEAVPYPDRIAKVLRELRIEEEIEKLEGRVR